MKKQILLTTLCSVLALNVGAETTTGTVTDMMGESITILTPAGEEMTLKATDQTTYRQKKVKKMKRKNKEHSYFKPMVEEDDLVEITYIVDPKDNTVYIIEDVVIWDD